jgi:hypothetical protein
VPPSSRHPADLTISPYISITKLKEKLL